MKNHNNNNNEAGSDPSEHKSSVGSAKATSSILAQTSSTKKKEFIGIRNETFDANNNSNDQTVSSVITEKVGQDHKSRSHSKLTEASLNETSNEEWQLLEVEEQLPGEEGNPTDSISGSGSITNTRNMSHKKLHHSARETATKTGRKYIDIDSTSQKDYSPWLVYICTSIYSLLPLASVLTALALICLLFTKYYFVTLIYIPYVFWTRKTFNRGGQRIQSIYYAKFWSYLAAYFPIKLRYSANFKLDPSENYILHYSPHGISAFGAVTAFATNALNFSQLFPGITARFMVHETSFIVPVMREAFAFRGDCSVNSKSIDHMLSKEGTGNLLTIVVGGLAEADLSDSEVLKIVVAKRKGFIKKALVHGANIIPCIAFGENSVFHKVNLKQGSLLHRLETFWYNNFGFKHPIYYGRSLISENYMGLLPYKRPITVVMGDPMIVNRVENPSQEEIDKLHEQYLKQLMSVYEDNSDLCQNLFDRKIEIL